MAEFEPAYKHMQKHEGGYANDPDDRGGETYRGISRKNWRGWDGWPDIDQAKRRADFPTCLDKNADLQGRVRLFYQRNFWAPTMQRLTSQELANWLFDKAVNMGIRQACKLIQRAANVDADGIIGPQTMAAVNAADPVVLLARCREEASRYYVNLALSDPSQSKFLHGWLARA